MPGELYRVLAATANARPAAPAFTFLDARGQPSTLTFSELFEAAEDIAGRIVTAGLQRRQGPLGILLARQQDQILHYLGALQAGVVPAILTPPNPKLNRDYYLRTTASVLQRIGLVGLITDVDDLDTSLPCYAPGTLDGRSPHGRAVSVSNAPMPDEASFLQFSSGTTGMKRGVLVTDRAVLAQLESYGSALVLEDDDVIVSWLPLYHDMGFIACLNLPLYRGLHTVMLDPIEWVTRPARFLAAVSNYEGTLAWNPNFAYSFMAQRIRDAEMGGVDLSSLRGLVNCSEPVTHASEQQFLQRFSKHGLRSDVFMGCYAMAETTFALTHGDPAADTLDPLGPSGVARRPGEEPYVGVGSALPGVELSVRNEKGYPLGDRVVGEFWVRSPFNFHGYYGDEVATAEVLADDWFRTGDLGYRLGDQFYVTGRRKDVLIVGGVNVFPSDLEETAAEVEGVVPGRTAAFAVFDDRLQTERIVLLAEFDSHVDDGQHDETVVVLEIRQRVLASFQIANFHVQLLPPGWLVKSSSGKVARLENRRKWLDRETAG